LNRTGHCPTVLNSCSSVQSHSSCKQSSIRNPVKNLVPSYHLDAECNELGKSLSIISRIIISVLPTCKVYRHHQREAVNLTFGHQ
jgi:hypothetical protein